MNAARSFFKQIHYPRLIMISSILVVVALFSFFIALAYTVSPDQDDLLNIICKYLSYIIAFPSFIISFFEYVQDLWTIGISILVGSITHSLIIEYIIYYYKKHKTIKTS